MSVQVAGAVLWVVGIVLVAGVSAIWLVTRRERYRPGAPAPGDEPTSEVVVDPETGRRQRVYMNPRSGRRVYVDEPGA